MKQIAVVSGKGGTGKTIVTASLACLAQNKVMVDCDVDAADLYILLHPEIEHREDFRSSKLPVIDYQKCDRCMQCQPVCRFDAIKLARRSGGDGPEIDPFACEGCGVCVHICPQKAIILEQQLDGEWFISKTKYGPLVYAKLGVAAENSGKLVSLIKQKAKELAEKDKYDYIIIDGPPGIGCSVIATIGGMDLVLAVAEPTVSGIHDLERVTKVAFHFKIPVAVCINKYDINLDNTKLIEDECRHHNIPVVGRISYDKSVPKSIVNCQPLVEYSNNRVSDEIKQVWQRILEIIQ